MDHPTGQFAVRDSGFSFAQLRSVVAAVPQSCLIVQETGLVLIANDKAIEFLGGDPAGQHVTFAFRAPAVLSAINDAVLKGEARQVHHALRVPTNQNLDIVAAPMGVNAEGQRIALVTFQDVTYQEQIERMRSDFVANASHELRTPLTSLTGFIETMQGPASGDIAAHARFLPMMKAQADRMARLIDDLLSLSRIEVSEHMAPTEKMDLVMIARQVASLLAPMAADAKCSLQLDLPSTVTVRGDAQQLTQVLHNLVENAIKYAGEGKAVEISLRTEDGNAILAVKDFGPGIAAHHVPRLTERFYRVSAQDSRKRGGTGLGLAIAKHIMNRHRGKLLIDSEPGVGSTFSMSMPVSF